MDPMEAIKITFFQECEEQLAELEAGLLAMEAGEADAEVVNAVFRAVHSIKGGAGAFGLDDLVKFSHVFETTLDEVRTGRLDPDPLTVLKPMLRATDVLADLVRAARDGGEVDAARLQQSADELNAGGRLPAEPDASALDDIDFGFAPLQLAIVEPTPPEPAGRDWIVRFKPKPDLYANANANANEAGLVIRELGQLGAASVELDTSALPSLDVLDPEGTYLAWTITLTTARPEADIRDVFEFVDGDCELSITPAAEDEPILPTAEPALEEAFDVMALIRKVQTAADAEVVTAPQSRPRP